MACATKNTDVWVTLVPPRPSPPVGILFYSLHSQRNYVPLVNLLGIYYQIRDDYMNLQSSQVSFFAHFMLAMSSLVVYSSAIFQYTTNKGFAEDLTEGKFSFPIVHGVRADPSNRQIISASWVILFRFIVVPYNLPIQMSYRSGQPHLLWKTTLFHTSQTIRNRLNIHFRSFEHSKGRPSMRFRVWAETQD